MTSHISRRLLLGFVLAAMLMPQLLAWNTARTKAAVASTVVAGWTGQTVVGVKLVRVAFVIGTGVRVPATVGQEAWAVLVVCDGWCFPPSEPVPLLQHRSYELTLVSLDGSAYISAACADTKGLLCAGAVYAEPPDWESIADLSSPSWWVAPLALSVGVVGAEAVRRRWTRRISEDN